MGKIEEWSSELVVDRGGTKEAMAVIGVKEAFSGQVKLVAK